MRGLAQPNSRMCVFDGGRIRPKGTAGGGFAPKETPEGCQRSTWEGLAFRDGGRGRWKALPMRGGQTDGTSPRFIYRLDGIFR